MTPKSCNHCVQIEASGAWFRRKLIESTATVGLCCTHKAPVGCHLGFLFCKVMLKHQISEVGRQSIVWFLISNFLSITSAKNCGNRIVFVKIIASQRWDVFETRCILILPIKTVSAFRYRALCDGELWRAVHRPCVCVCVCLFVCVSVRTITFEVNDPWGR